ncbi:MAG: hypothetical protein HOB49_28060, partial [Gemmatimonadetes bacterium]|nr:hypothetical protein [Gemmatimonadota bacterium]
CVIGSEADPHVDIVADVLDPVALDSTPVKTARAVILAFDADSTTLLATTVMRAYAPDVPIIASVSLVENVGRIQQAGADFALSVSQVAGQILAHHVLGETVSHQPRIKLLKVQPGGLVGSNPIEAQMRERTGCSVVAIERAGEIMMDIPPTFSLVEEDAMYLCGTADAFNRLFDQYPVPRS